MAQATNNSGGYSISVKMGTALVTEKNAPQKTAVVFPKENKKVVSKWGDNNSYPQELLKKAEQISLLIPLLDWKGRALYGDGLAYGFMNYDEDGNEKFTPIIDDEIDKWLKATDITSYLSDACSYFYYFYNIFPELILSKDRKKINKITCQETTEARWGVKEKGVLTKCFLSSRWDEGASINDKETKTLPVINLLSDWQKTLSTGKKSNYIFPIYYSSPNRRYYQKAPWEVLITSKWYEIALKVPAFKSALMDNLLAIKYIIHIPEWWWDHNYPGFEEKELKERKKIEGKVHDKFNKFLSGAAKQGKSILVTAKAQAKGTEFAQWKIEAVDNKMKEGLYIEDSQEADSHIFKNLNVDPTIFGSGPGKNTQSSGSGSDKRVAWNMYITQQKVIQDQILKPLQYIADYNGWTERLKKEDKNKGRFLFWFKSKMITTLDAGETKNT